VQLQFSSVVDLGETSVDIRRRILPACVGNRHGRAGNWESPVLVIPLSHVHGGKCAANHEIGQAVGHLTLAFTVDTDPEEILSAVDAETRSVAAGAAAVADDLGVSLQNWMENIDVAWLAPGSQIQQQQQPQSKSGCDGPLSTLMAPSDLAPDGWISHTATNGRVFWHHKALGPAPWEKEKASAFRKKVGDSSALPKEIVTNIRDQIAQRSAEAPVEPIYNRRGATASLSSSTDRVDAPEEDPDAWVSHKGPDGRLFWHHLALGPPPWESDRNQRCQANIKCAVPPGMTKVAYSM